MNQSGALNMEPLREALQHEGPEQTARLLDQAFIRLTMAEIQEGNCIDADVSRILFLLYVLRDAVKNIA